jgi:hypothetical protein
MTIDTEKVREWFKETEGHPFHFDDSVLISHHELANNTPFGLMPSGKVLVLLDKSLYDYSFKIHDLIELAIAREFVSESDGRALFGSGLIVRADSIDARTRFVCLFDRLLSTSDSKLHLEEFFELLRKAAQQRSGFHAPALFAELLVLKLLLNSYPDIVSCWRSSGQSIIDISASDVHPEIEVKSTTNLDTRRHRLSLHQVRHFIQNQECTLASVQVHEDSRGSSCKDLCETLIELIGDPDSEGSKILASYLLAFAEVHEFSEVFFSEVYTMSSIIFFRPLLEDLGVAQPPPWLCSASFEIDFNIVPKQPVFIGPPA